MKKSMDITPDKSLIQKTGLAGYSTSQALAELVDNSIDARLDGCVQVVINLDFRERRITVSDDGRGMDLESLRGAMTVARGTKPDGSLGQFGMGMKSSCSALGKRFHMRTSAAGSSKEYEVSYNEDEWLTDATAGWGNFVVIEKDLTARDDWHGTVIAVDDLKVRLYANQVTNLKKNFGRRYGSYIENGSASIRVNRTYCSPFHAEVDGTSRINVDINLGGEAKMHGYVELLKVRSIGGMYGMDLYRHGRLIRPHVKFGFPEHPKNALITGRLDLNHVPVNFQKNDFIRESQEYRDALHAFKMSEAASKIQMMSQSSNQDAPPIGRVFESFTLGSIPPGTWTSMSASSAARVLRGTEPFTTSAGGRTIRVSIKPGGPGPMYSVRDEEGTRIVTINRDSASFSFVKNPLFLVGMVAAEAAAMPSGRQFTEFVMARNDLLEKSLRGLRGGGGRPRMRRARLPDVPGYGLAGELIDMHDHLVENAYYKFQFTAMSTLAPYMHDARRQIVYTVHTTTNRGDDLVAELSGMLADRGDAGIVVIDRPSRQTLSGLLANRGIVRIIAVREYGSVAGSTVAEPEKAIVDLAAESKMHGIPVDLHEVGRILSRMTRDGIADPGRVRKLAGSTKRSTLVEGLFA